MGRIDSGTTRAQLPVRAHAHVHPPLGLNCPPTLELVMGPAQARPVVRRNHLPSAAWRSTAATATHIPPEWLPGQALRQPPCSWAMASATGPGPLAYCGLLLAFAQSISVLSLHTVMHYVVVALDTEQKHESLANLKEANGEFHQHTFHMCPQESTQQVPEDSHFPASTG